MLHVPPEHVSLPLQKRPSLQADAVFVYEQTPLVQPVAGND